MKQLQLPSSIALSSAALAVFVFSASAQQTEFVAREVLQQPGGFALNVVELSKPVSIRSIEPKQLKAGQNCKLDLESVRKAISRELNRDSNILSNAEGKPAELHLSLHAEIRGEEIICKGEGTTCGVFVSIPPETKLVTPAAGTR